MSTPQTAEGMGHIAPGAYLPLELLESVVDVIAMQPYPQPSRQTIKCLSLTCRGLVPRCRRYLFRLVGFGRFSDFSLGFTYPRPNSSRVQAFLALLKDSRRHEALGAPIGEFVQVLILGNNFHPLFPQITAPLPNLSQFLWSSTLGCLDTHRESLDHEALHQATGGEVASLDHDVRKQMLEDDRSVQLIIERVRRSITQPDSISCSAACVACQHKVAPPVASAVPRSAVHPPNEPILSFCL